MFISYKKGVEKNAKLPTILYGYGGFNISLTPGFKAQHIAWMESGGVFASANLRGGGEYGKEWHDAGKRANKQNVFDDFASAAKYLIREGWTSAQNLGVNGGSNGGLLVGAMVNQHPELIAAAIPEVGVMDMLRFHRFTIGWAWKDDYGDPENADDFKVLLAYSPIHNLKMTEAYPPVMVMTADHDDRVVPAHSFKYGASLQYIMNGCGIALMRIQESAGHGAGTPTAIAIEMAADRLAFFAHHLK
jgi:prolyl oligopeptidase